MAIKGWLGGFSKTAAVRQSVQVSLVAASFLSCVVPIVELRNPCLQFQNLPPQECSQIVTPAVITLKPGKLRSQDFALAAAIDLKVVGKPIEQQKVQVDDAVDGFGTQILH